jgi:hypothetical protein
MTYSASSSHAIPTESSIGRITFFRPQYAMNTEKISDDIRRFILVIPSIPYLEAMLLLRNTSSQLWVAEKLAQSLFIQRETAEDVLKDLCTAGICVCQESDADQFKYQPRSGEIDAIIGRLAKLYAENLIEVTNIIHSNANRNQRIQQFADAFKWRKET